MKALQLLYRPVQGGMETLANTLHDSFHLGGIDVVTAPLEPDPVGSRSMLKRIASVRALIKTTNPSVVLSHSTIPNFYARLAAPSSLPVICVLHSATDEWADSKVRLMEIVLQRRTKAVVAVSVRKSLDYRRRFPNASGKIHVIPNGIRPPVRPVVGRASIPQLLFAARVTPQKNLLALVEACSLLKSRGIPFHLRVAGQEPDEGYADQIRRFIKMNNLADCVEMLGNRVDVPQLMAESDLLVHPSLAEAHSLTLLEAAAHGLPAIVTAQVRPTLDPRMVVASYDGLSRTDLSHSLCEVLQEIHVLRKRAESVAECLARDYSIETTTRKYIELLNQVCSDQRDGH